MLATAHPTRSELEGFFLADLGPREKSQVVSHLLDECPGCIEAVSTLLSSGGQTWRLARRKRSMGGAGSSPRIRSAARGQYGSVVASALAWIDGIGARLERERAAARVSLAQLLEQPPERQRILVINCRRFQNWATCENLLEAAFSQRHNDPAKAQALSALAVTVASRLESEGYPPAQLADLQSRCWALLANARRICNDYPGAEEALRQARVHLAHGSGCELEEALLADVETSLHSALRRYDRALCSIGRSISIYWRLGQTHLLGRALIQKGMVCGYAGDLDAEVALLRSGLPLVDLDRDPRVAVSGWHNLCCALHSAGYHRQALGALARARPLYLQLGDRTALLRFQWLEGTIAAALDRNEQAEGCLRETAEGFVQLGLSHDAALATLDLAALLARQGRHGEVGGLATGMIAVFQSWGTETEALAALVLLRKAAVRERLSETLLARLGASLRRERSTS